MKRKIICLGVLSLLAGVIFVLTIQRPALPPMQPDVPVTENAIIQSLEGKVVANDETADSPPRMITVNEPLRTTTPTYASKTSVTGRGERTVVINNKEYPLRTYKPLMTPNDPTASQWWVPSTKLDQAWDIPRGNHETVLAIIDTGFGLKHEEFADRWYTNPGESGTSTSEQPSVRNCSDRSLPMNASCNLIDDDNDGVVDNESGGTTYQNPSRLNCTDQSRPLTRDCNRIDDDSNGHIDDHQGWDFINNDNSTQAGELNPSGSGTTHGTMVSGVAAASGNNSKGIAGVDWNTKILPIQALDDDSYGDTLSVGRAIFYAASQGADVISLSLGSDLPDDYVKEAVHAAIISGSVVVAASGNGGCGCMVYPANYPEVVAVGALTSNNLPASCSSWGANLDIMAPGTQITTTNWQSSNPTTAYVSGVNGTSFAAPLVGGMMTRLLSHQPSATPVQLISALTENTNRLTIPVNTPRDLKLGYGALDSLKSTSRMITPRDTSQLYAFKPVSTGGHLKPASEISSPYAVHSCPDGTVPSTPIYELSKSGSHFFSISGAESSKALSTGHLSQLFAHACIQQPHDPALFGRNIDLFREFRNIFKPI